jgi:hypothetical protein
VAQVARGAQLVNLPREKRRAWPRRLLVVCDRSAHLAPLVADQKDLIRPALRGIAGPLSALSPGAETVLRVMVEADLALDLVDILKELDPPQGGACLVLGDLGVLSAPPGETARGSPRVRRWAEIGQALNGAGCRPIALTPYPAALAPSDLRRFWRLTEWDRHAIGGELDPEKRARHVERLLTLTAPAKRIEPGLLRAMRRNMTPGADAGAELAFWAHPAISGMHLDAASFDPERQRDYLALFAELPEAERRQACEIIASWRSGLKAVWFQEILSLPLELQRSVSPEDLADARAYMRYFAAKGVEGGQCVLPCSYQAWISRAGQASPELHKNEHFAHLALSIEGYRAPEGVAIDPQHIAPTGDVGAVRVSQRGGDFRLSTQEAAAGGSPLLSLPSANGALLVRPDRTDDFWADGDPPRWARRWGVDEHGPWVSFEVGWASKVVEQRLRWCPPGAFRMGSPASEAGRFGDEGPQHDVRFAEGYWLMDTPVTQALYEAAVRVASMLRGSTGVRGYRTPAERTVGTFVGTRCVCSRGVHVGSGTLLKRPFSAM